MAPATKNFKLQANPRADAALDSFVREDRFPHAILIEGPQGSGKSTFARRVAMAVLCRGEGKKPCGNCGPCRKVSEGIHPDLHIYEGEGKSRSFHVDKVRELRAQAYIRPGEGDRKILLLEDAHTMTEQAQNALLKVLEEPPQSAIFLLTVRNRSQLLETIRSRVVVIPLEYPDVAACVDILAGYLPGRPREELQTAAENAMGSVGLALEALSEEGEPSPHRDCALAFLQCLAQGDEGGALAALGRYERDRAGFAAMLDILGALVAHHMRAGGYRMKGASTITQLQLVRLAAIIEETAAAAFFNVGGTLLASALCAKTFGVMN